MDSANKVDHYIKLNKESLLAETQVKSSFVKQSENEFIVNLRVIENQSNLIDLNLNVSSEKQANHICNNWKKNASHMCAEVINLLTTYKKQPTNKLLLQALFLRELP